MAYIQTSLLGLSGQVQHGNTITMEIWKNFTTPFSVFTYHKFKNLREKQKEKIQIIEPKTEERNTQNAKIQSEYLLPAMATFNEPPNTKKNEIAIWGGEDWIIESDYRGQTQVDIETKEISKIEYIGSVKNG